MIRDYGTIKPGSTIYLPFHTFDSNDPSASVTLTGLAVTDIEVYKDASMTQRGSDNGYTLLDTDGIDLDGITGIHGLSIDLSDNSTAGFWAAGSHYTVVVSSVTVDAATINFVLGTFRIGNEAAVLNTTIATLSTQTSFTLTTGPAEDDSLNGCVVYIHDVASAVQGGFAVVQDYTGSTKTVTLVAGTTFTAAATDNISVFPPALQATTPGRTLDVSSGGEAGLDWANVGSPTTTVGLSGTTVKTATDVETDTADIQSRLPAALTGAGNIKADMLAISEDATAADRFETMLDGTGGQTLSLGSLVISGSAINGVLEIVNTGGVGTRIVGTVAGAIVSSTTANKPSINLSTAGGGLSPGIVGADYASSAESGTTTTVVDSTRTEADTDYWKGSYIRFTSGTIAGQTRLITGFTPASDTITFAPAVTQAVTTNTYEIIRAGRVDLHSILGTVSPAAAGSIAPDWGQVQNQSTSVNLSATTVNLVNTLTTYTGNTVQTGDSYAIVNSGTHGNAAIKGYVDDIGTAGAGLTAIPWNAAWDAEVQSEVQDAIEVNHLDHFIAVADPGGVVANSSFLAKMLSKSATPAFSSYDNTTDSLEALRDNVGTAGASILTTAMTESYRSAGATATLAQFCYEIIAHMGESAISGTTKTLKKLDASTTAKTYTLDSSTSPTSITETT